MAGKYDVIIIGGGIAGLFAGLTLQKLGKRSIILEHGQQVGGNMSGVWRKGFYFDCGDQSTEDVGVLFPMLKDLGLYDPDDWTRARFRYVTRDCDVMLHEYGRIREDFKKAFPGSASGVDKWFDYITPLCGDLQQMMGSGLLNLVPDSKNVNLSSLKMMGRSSKLVRSIPRMLTKTGDEMALETFPDDSRLSYLFGQGSARNLPLMMHLFFWYTFVQDYWYPVAGLQGMLDKLADAYRERGGEIRFKSTVDKVITSGKTVTAVETCREERFEAAHVINTGNPKRLINEMLDDPTLWDYKDRQITTAGQLTPAVCSAFLGLDMSSDELRKHMKAQHTIYWRNYETAADKIYDPEAHNKGWCMISATSLDHPHLAPPGKSSLVAQVFTPYHWMDGWGTGTDDPFARTPRYRKLKKKVLDDIIRETEYIIPGLSEKVVYKEMATPRSMSRWTLNPEGAIMGWTYDRFQCHMANSFVQFRTPLTNLFNAGHYAIWPGGVVNSAMTARIVARGIYHGFWKQFLK
jgi:all-trans-retinol 13,14-reductase